VYLESRSAFYTASGLVSGWSSLGAGGLEFRN